MTRAPPSTSLLMGRCADARIVGADAVGHRHVEVNAYEHALAARFKIVDRGDIGHFRLLFNEKRAARSRPLFRLDATAAILYQVLNAVEKPHSLSYQETTFTRLDLPPMTMGQLAIEDGRVVVADDIDGDDRVLGVPRMPASSPSAASFMAAPIFDGDSRSSSTVRSTMEPSGVGTGVAEAVELARSSGSTSDTARAAPVVVGPRITAAARARRRSLCGRSRIFWLFVGWNGVHVATLDAELQQHLGHRSQAVRGAGSVGDDVVLFLVVIGSSLTPMTMVTSSPFSRGR